ncbi:MAG: radical SAM protein [Clostridiales bacterium]
MEYKPVTGVWEITMGCNLRCMHCGSSCENALEGELTTNEAVSLAKDLGILGFKWLTLSGGEPTIRKDWDIIAKALYDNGIIPNIITNGWLFTKETIERAEKAHVNTIAISLDGLKDTHDAIRREGSYDRIMSALDLFKGSTVHPSIITTVNRKNINELTEILKILNKKRISGWQLQIILPMGNTLDNKDLLMGPADVDEIIDFAYNAMKNAENKVNVRLADCLGYFNNKEIEIRAKDKKNNFYSWQGCNAGKYSLGILHNGDIIGCTSVRDKEYIEGNIRKTPIKEIWESEKSFQWNRNLKKENLKGFCKKCGYGSKCLGGCANTRVTMTRDINGENEYCSYNYSFKIAEKQLEDDSLEDLYEKAELFIEKNNFQLAEICLKNIIEKDENYKKTLSLSGYVNFMLENYEVSKFANQKILLKNPNDVYANKGMGLCLSKTGYVEEGINYLKKSIELTKTDFMDPYYDLAVVYYENNLIDESISILKKGIDKSNEFEEKVDTFYNRLLEVKSRG